MSRTIAATLALTAVACGPEEERTVPEPTPAESATPGPVERGLE
mgnify:CR=1 FL=1